MPLRQIRELNPHVYLGFWEITESPEELSALLNKYIGPNPAVVPTFTHAARQRQWLASRVLAYSLLQKFTPEPLLLQTDANGKPIVPASAYQVSISHCRDLAAVIVSDGVEVGIDIEFISPKVMRVADKFMVAAEKKDANEDIEKTLIYWSGKETLYKLYSKKRLLFKEHLFINSFNKVQAGTLTAQIAAPDCQKNYHLHYEIWDQHILTYSIDC